MKNKETNVERFYSWMLSMNNKWVTDQERMSRAFHIVALCDVNDIEVIEPVIVKPN